LTVGKALPPSPGKINTCLDNKKNNNKIKKEPEGKSEHDSVANWDQTKIECAFGNRI